MDGFNFFNTSLLLLPFWAASLPFTWPDAPLNLLLKRSRKHCTDYHWGSRFLDIKSSTTETTVWLPRGSARRWQWGEEANYVYCALTRRYCHDLVLQILWYAGIFPLLYLAGEICNWIIRLLHHETEVLGKIWCYPSSCQGEYLCVPVVKRQNTEESVRRDDGSLDRLPPHGISWITSVSRIVVYFKWGWIIGTSSM